MTSLAGTVAYGARGSREVSESIFGTLQNSPVVNSPELPGSGSHNTCFGMQYLVSCLVLQSSC